MDEALSAYMLNPLFDRVVVEPDEDNEVRPSGLIIPTGRPKPDTGTIVACGPGKVNNFGVTDAMPVKVGDRVLFHQHSGVEVTVDDGQYIIMNSGDVIATIQEREGD